MNIRLDAASQRPLYLQLRDAMRGQLLSGTLPSGMRLPSSRELAKSLNVSRNTVDAAFLLLREDGLIDIRRGLGAFASVSPTKQQESAPLIDWDAAIAPNMRAFANFREGQGRVELGSRKVISFATLAPDYNFFDVDEFRSCLSSVLSREGPVLLAYGYTRGYEPLREYIAQYLSAKGLLLSGQDILMVSGFRQAAQLIVEALVREGESILVEAPTYNGFLGIVSAKGANAVPVHCDDEGMIESELEKAILQHSPKLLYLIPTYHNPTGRNMTLQRRSAILRIARAHNLPILEDGFNEELRFMGEYHPALKALSGSGDVIHAGSFSKILFPGIRLGWIVGPAKLMRYLTHAKYNQDIHSPPLLQAALKEYLIRGHLERYLRKIRPLYRMRMDALYQGLDRHFAGRCTYIKAEGGFSAYLTFPESFNARQNMEKALKNGVLYAPGDAFYPGEGGQNSVRLGFSRLTPPMIDEGLQILSRVFNEAGV